MDCCKQHGLPIKCLEQKLESNTESEHNDTHMVITTIISKECHDFKSVLHECKKQCMTNGAPNKKLIQSTNHKHLNSRLESQGESFHVDDHTITHARSENEIGVYPNKI